MKTKIILILVITVSTLISCTRKAYLPNGCRYKIAPPKFNK